MKHYDVSLRRRAAMRKISYQFPNYPECQLMCAIVMHAIIDLGSTDKAIKLPAIRYLSGSIYHAELCEVDSVWIREVLTKCGVELK